MNKRLLIITTSYPLAKGSVSGLFVKKLVDELSNYFHTEVICPADNLDNSPPGIICAKYAPRKLQTLAHSAGGIPAALSRSKWSWLLLPVLLFSLLKQLFKHTKQADAILANWAVCGLLAILPSIIFRKPLVTILRGSDVSVNVKLIPKVFIKLVLRHSRFVVAVSPHIENYLKECFPDYREKIVLISNGVECSKSAKEDNDICQLLWVGNLVPNKAPITIIEACRHLAKHSIKFHLAIIGEGHEKERLQMLVNQYNLKDNIFFYGNIAHEAVLERFRKADIFVLTSIAEGRSNVLLEAMAAATACIAAAIPSVESLIEDGRNGILFSPGDPMELMEKLLTLINDRNLRLCLGENARIFIDQNKILWSYTGQAYCRLLQTVISEQASCAV